MPLARAALLAVALAADLSRGITAAAAAARSTEEIVHLSDSTPVTPPTP